MHYIPYSGKPLQLVGKYTNRWRKHAHHIPGGQKQSCVSADEALQFLGQYTAEWPGYVSVTALSSKCPAETQTVAVDQVEDLRSFIESCNCKRNLYFGVNPIATNQNKKAAKSDIAALAFLHADLDPRDGCDLSTERNRVKKQIDGFPIKPNLIIDSGNGFQVFWRLRDPVPVNGNIEQLESYNRRLATLLGADHCWNIDRLMRLPGTVNLPDARKRARGRRPAFAKAIRFDEGAYALEDFDALLDGAGGAQAHDSWQSAINVDDLRVSDEIKRLIREGKPKGQRSEAIFAVIRAMVKAGHTDTEISAILLDPANMLSEKPLALGPAWLQDEIRRGRAKPDASRESGQDATGSSARSGAQNDPLSHIVNAADLVRRELPEPRWIIDGLIPEGLTLFAGKSKMGKSWWALQTAIDVAIKQGDVLYLALEDTQRRLQDRIMRQCGNKEAVPSRLQLVPQSPWPRLDVGGLAALRRWLSDHDQARLIILDTFAKVKPNAKRNGNLYDEDYSALAGVKQLADEFKVAIIVVHHLRKMPDTDDPFNEISGTTGLTGCADTIMVLKRPRNSNRADFHVTGRDIEERKIPMTWEPTSCKWTMSEDAQNDQDDLHEGRKTIINLLQKRGPMTMSEIIKELGEKEGTVKSRLSRMVKDGQLANHEGKYSVLIKV